MQQWSLSGHFQGYVPSYWRSSAGAAVLQAVKGQHNKVSAEEAIAAIKRQGDDDADALSAQDEDIIAQLFSQRATQVCSHHLHALLCRQQLHRCLQSLGVVAVCMVLCIRLVSTWYSGTASHGGGKQNQHWASAASTVLQKSCGCHLCCAR